MKSNLHSIFVQSWKDFVIFDFTLIYSAHSYHYFQNVVKLLHCLFNLLLSHYTAFKLSLQENKQEVVINL